MVVLVVLCLFSQNLVIWRIPCIGRLTYRSFTSSVIIFVCSSKCIVLRSSATSCVFFVVWVCGRFIRLFNVLLRYLAVLYAGACVLFTVSLMGLFSCVFLCIH